jgi:hypothetical protein
MDDQTVQTAHNYRYLYAGARFTDFGYFMDRLGAVRIELQTGTNNWDSALRDYADVFTRRPISEDNQVIVGPLHVPRVPSTFPTEYEWHLTHLPIYRIMDRLARYRGVLNNEHRYIWAKDLRIAGAFFAHKINGVIEAAQGRFEPADVGSTVEWENGDRDEIIGYINPTHVRYSADQYYREWNPWMACAIGNGRVMRASQTGDVVTRTHGDTFTVNDERKTIWHSDGTRSYIERFVDANTVIVHDSVARVIEGITLDPRYRYYCDQVTDDTLRTRIKNLTLPNRGWEPIRNSNVGALAPGVLLCARRGEGELHYGQITDGIEYLAGFHNRGYQISKKITDPIQAIVVTPDRFVALCNNRCWYGDSNRMDFITLPEIREAVAYLTGIDSLEADIGCFDWGSIQPIEKGLYMMVTAEPGGVGLRRFDGYQFGPNELEVPRLGMDRYMREFRNLVKATSSIHDGFMGYILWGAPRA